MTSMMEDDFDSGDNLLDNVAEEDLLTKAGDRRDSGQVLVGDPARHATKDSAADTEKLGLAQKISKRVFGYQAFSHEQQGAISCILGGNNALIISPTGTGKSLCYQIPAVAFPEIDGQTEERHAGDSGITIVVSHLIVRMVKQADVLRRKGVTAECLDWTKTGDEIKQINESLGEGQLRILYCEPERLNDDGFVETIKRVRGGWDPSFRSDYLKVAQFVKEINAERVICLTATTSPLVTDDICKAFNIAKDGVFQMLAYRSNLRLEVQATDTRQDRFDSLCEFLRTHPGSTLVYVNLQREARELARDLAKQNIPADFCHAGVRPDDKYEIQDRFMASKIRIIVTTIMFGMAVNKSDVRNIVHFDVPRTVEEYCQQIGRGGRDGKPSNCMLYFCKEDFHIKENSARGNLLSRRSVQNLLKDIFSDEVARLPIGETFKTSRSAQCSKFDIPRSTINIIYTALELRFNLICAISADYGWYKFEAMSNYVHQIKSNKSPEAKAISQHAVKARKYYSIDVYAAAQSSNLSHCDLIKLLNDLEESGAIQLIVSGVDIYKVLTELPKTNAEITSLRDLLYEYLQGREQPPLSNIKEMVDVLTASKCLSRSIVDHFGKSLPDDKDGCGNCTFCLTGKSVQISPPTQMPVDKSLIQRVLAATDVRDDARFLARVAFGIRSPRVSRLKLDRSPVFMSMAHQDFEKVLSEFQKECDEDV